jgi:hypothetical protein
VAVGADGVRVAEEKLEMGETVMVALTVVVLRMEGEPSAEMAVDVMGATLMLMLPSNGDTKMYIAPFLSAEETAGRVTYTVVRQLVEEEV